jgi:hypothetical protein
MKRFVYRDQIRAQQAAADADSGSPDAISNARMVSTDDFPLNSDTVHYSGEGQFRLGSAFAKKMLELGAAE